MTDIFTIGLKADSSDIQRGADDLDQLANSADKADSSAGNLRKGINEAGTAIATFGATAAAALGAVTVAASNTAQEITVLAQRANVSTDEFQRSAFAARAVSLDMQGLSDIFQDVNDRVGDFLTTGAGPMADFFETVGPKVGVTAEQFRNLNGRDALQLYVSSLEAANLSQAEMVFFMEALSSESTRLLPLLANNGEEFNRLANRAEELGLVLDNIDIENLQEMRDAMNESTAIASAMGNVIGATLAPFVTDLSEKFNENAMSAHQVRDAMIDIIEIGVSVAGVFADAGRAFEITGRGLGALAFTMVEGFNTIETRLELAGAQYQAFTREYDLLTIEWMNSFTEKLYEGFEDGLNAIVEFINSAIASFRNSGLGSFLEELGAEFNELSAFELEAPRIDTTSFQNDVNYWKAVQSSLEKSLTQSNTNIAAAWEDVRELMLEPLPSEGLDEWFNSIKKIIEQQSELRREVEKTGRTQQKTAEESAQIEIGAFSDVTRTALRAFDEQSTAREALLRADQAFTAIELALSLKRSAANAIEAISNQGKGDPYTAFARVAAMAGVMAGLGLFSGGGGVVDPTQGRQDTQGTGSVLGDSSAQSQSIANASERFEDIQIDQLAELRGIRTGLRALSSGIDQLARQIVGGNMRFDGGQFNLGETQNSSTAGIFGIGGAIAGAIPVVGDILSSIGSAIFGSTKTELLDSGITFFSQTLGEVFESGEVEAALYADIQKTTKRLFGLSQSTSTSRELEGIDTAITSQIADIFGFIGDTVISAAESLGFETVTVVEDSMLTAFDFGGLGIGDRFRDLLGPMLSESVELPLQEALDRFSIDLPEISFEGLNGEEIQQELEAVFSQQADLIAEYLVPSITEYQQVGEGAFDTLTRVAREQAIFNTALERMGVSLGDVSNIMRIDIAQSITALVGGAEQFSDLVSSFTAEFFSEAEQFEMLTDAITGVLDQLGVALFESRDQYRELIESIDVTTEEGQQLFAALLELNPALDDFFDILEDNAAEEAAAAQRELEEAQQASAEAAQLAAQALHEAGQTAEQAYSALSTATREAQRELQDNLSLELSGIREEFDTRTRQADDSLAFSLDVISQNFERQRDAERERAAAEQDRIRISARAASAQASSLSSLVGALNAASISLRPLTQGEGQAQLESALARARQGGSLAGSDLRDAIQAASNLDASNFGSSFELTAARARAANVTEELADLAGDQLSQAEQLQASLNAQTEAVRAASDRELEAIAQAQESAEEQAEALHASELEAIAQERADAELAAQMRFDQEFTVLQDQLDTARAQLDALLGIDRTMLGVQGSLNAFQAAINALQEQVAGMSAEASPSNVVAFTPPASGQPQAAGYGFAPEDVLNSVAMSSAATARILQRWDGDGQPEVRT